MAAFVHLQILPGQPHPVIALTPSNAQVPAVPATPFALPPAVPVDGPTLWQALPEAVRQSLRQLYSLQPDPPVTLWLDVQMSEVVDWPWELLAPAAGLQPFACTPRTPLARAYPTAHVLPVRRPGALHLLAITATPRDQPPADPRPALQHLRRLDPARVVVEIREHLPATELRETLMQLQPDLLLFIGHGTPEAIVFEDEWGDSHRLNGPELAAALTGTLVRAVVLASCSGATPYADGRSIATALLDGGALAVVAMRGPVAAESADAFLHGLLDSLARSQPVEVAAAEGRSQMIAALGAQEGDWMLPVCWQRAPGHPLVVPADAALTQGARTLAANAKAPSLAGALASGGLLGLLAVCSLQSLFLPQTLAVPAIVKLLEGLGLNVLAGYLGEALKDVWRRTGRPEVPRAEVSKAIRRIARDKEDAATEIAQLARDSGALQATLEAINAHITGSEALLQGLRRDVERHTAVLGVLQIELREVKQGVWEVFRVAKEVRQDTRAIREDTAAMRPQINEIHEQVTADANQRRAQEQMLLRDYLSTLSQDCNRLSLADYDSSDPNKLAIDLDSVYVRLEVARTVDQEGRQRAIGREPRDLTALEALAEQPRLVLLGVPGSGKSTFVNFLARCLALARLEDQPRWLERLGAEWPHGPLVPIQITLRKFAAWVAEQNPPIDHGDAGLPWRFLAATQGDGLAACLRRLAHDGRALLLFDGLDEVAADERDWPLVPVRESIAALARGLAPGSRALVTCRVLDYQWQPRRLADWPDDTIAPLSEPLQEQFIHNWYAALERLRRPLLDTAAALKERLTRAVRERRELRRLAGNPLLLTMMALVQSYKGRLPEERVRLYAECIEFLLHRWRARPEERSLRDRLDLPQWSETNLYELLELLGHATHLRETNPDDERGADLPYKLLIDIAQSYFEAYGKRSYWRAEEFAAYINQASNGILQVDMQLRSKDITYRFPHRTFQEYLAGRALTNDGLRLSDEQPDAERDLITRALRYVDAGPQWREALLLAASQHALNGRSREVVDLVQELQADARAAKLTVAQARRIMLAGEMLLEVGRERIARLGERRAAIWEQTRDNLLPLLPYPPSTAMPPLAPVERARAALVLARLGDPRPGVCTLEPDWCGPFPAGKYPIADGKATLRLEEFRIARYPVTVWQFRQFWEDPQGYENERLWPPLGWQWKQRKPVTRQPPYRWGDPEWTADNQPVVGISWYEAVAFCNWLTRRGHAERWLKPDEVIRLPSEAEWEVAAMWDARARQMRAWQPPKGEIWQNVEEAGIGRTAPVGLFPQGASPCGALDMAGNVWEWCGSAYDDYPAQAHRLCDDFPPGEIGPAMRGGSYYLQNARSSWGARVWLGPARPERHQGLSGVRVLRSTVSGVLNAESWFLDPDLAVGLG